MSGCAEVAADDTEVFDLDPELFQDVDDFDWIDVKRQQFELRGKSDSVSSLSTGSANSSSKASFTSLMQDVDANMQISSALRSIRVVIHVDLDCFFVQVEQSLNSHLRGLPVAVHQHEDIISVSYEARALGVKKHMTPAEALAVTNGAAVLVPMPVEHGSKVSYRLYREASARTLEVAKKCAAITASSQFEKSNLQHVPADSEPGSSPASGLQSPRSQLFSSQAFGAQDFSDSAWPDCIIYGGVSGLLALEDECLRLGNILAHNIRDDIRNQLGFSCSAGIAANKLLAKIASGLNKPRSQTVILPRNVSKLMKSLPIRKLPRVLSRAGHRALTELEKVYSVATCGDLVQQEAIHSKTELISRYGELCGSWLYTRARGEDDEPVRDKGPQKTIACSMSLTPFGPNPDQLRKILNMISSELADRLRKDFEDNDRKPEQFYLLYRNLRGKEKHCHTPLSAIIRSALPGECDLDEGRVPATAIVTTAMSMFLKSVKDDNEPWNLRWIALCFGQFSKIARDGAAITAFFQPREALQQQAAPILIDDDDGRENVAVEDEDCFIVEPPPKKRKTATPK